MTGEEGITFGSSLTDGIGEGAVWQRTTGTSFQGLLDLYGVSHELFHLVGRVEHGSNPTYPGQAFPDTAWDRLYTPSMTELGFGLRHSWDGIPLPQGQVLGNLDFSNVSQAEKWLVAASVETFGPAQSQCGFMRADPNSYLAP
jgi:hypothetical protein